jgi:hypothetical protein
MKMEKSNDDACGRQGFDGNPLSSNSGNRVPRGGENGLRPRQGHVGSSASEKRRPSVSQVQNGSPRERSTCLSPRRKECDSLGKLGDELRSCDFQKQSRNRPHDSEKPSGIGLVGTDKKPKTRSVRSHDAWLCMEQAACVTDSWQASRTPNALQAADSQYICRSEGNSRRRSTMRALTKGSLSSPFSMGLVNALSRKETQQKMGLCNDCVDRCIFCNDVAQTASDSQHPQFIRDLAPLLWHRV